MTEEASGAGGGLPAGTADRGDAVVLRGERLSKTYATRVVHEVDLELSTGRVHVLAGGNGSGKSTLLKMLAGVVPADAGGTIVLGGRRIPAESYSPRVARAGGLRFVHQDLGLVDQLSIAENFALEGGHPRRLPGWIDDRRLLARTGEDLRRAGLGFDPRLPVGALRPSDRTLVAVARALREDPDAETSGVPLTLVLDEPTASLPITEVDRLLERLHDLRAAGHGIALVTHRLSEVMRIADEVTVLRDGRVVGAGPIADFDEDRILALIAGHVPERLTRQERDTTRGPVVLGVRGLSAGPLQAIDLDVHRGEIVGVAGLVGSGRTTLLRALFGDVPATGGISLDGEAVRIRDTGDAVAHRIALVPEDRVREAAYLDAPVWENLSAASVSRYRTRLGVSARRERRAAPALISRFRVRTPSAGAPLAALSGGNQQKVVLARWLQTEPRVLLLDEPTQGVDAVARDDIHRTVRDTVDGGACAVVVSSDVEELEQLCDRVIVLHGGRLVQTLAGARVRRDILTAAIQQESRVA
ncbi:sugar ABC transporter ATP-binding protein [Microbacterium sp. SORGH_AS_0888]|uniref:sugar ABC transporter ATP-binding protein n=1 Tax=Microbacterium sp. SORGH_AS_0888 TaxID=3041791 RepID=UPI0027805548|nr:sugar ABC transporter ATP-binding protein [Microbacterium sp. SORGH_AS_0888]MDQ1129223.1 ribose transport system ATP-binding protein [Microbacterium sp. SORGH_AS_0888]